MMRKHCYGSFDSPSRIATDCPEELNHLICELLEKEPEKRPNDALAVMRRLERIRGKGSGRKWSSAMRSDEQPTMVDLGATPEPRVDREAPGLKPKRISLGSDDYERYTVPWWNRTWALAIGLLLAVSLAVYGLWPKSAEAIFRQAETAAAEESWGNVLVELDRLQGRTMDSDLQQRVDALRQQAQSEISAKRRPSGIGGLPQSEAERCYRDALQDYHAGRVEKARSKWQAILDAFQGIPAHEPWLRLARQALNQTETEKKEAEAIEEVIQRANKESKPERTRRLEALLELYRERQDEAGRLLLARIQRELKDS
jgi:serine/threonine-protein kinase